MLFMIVMARTFANGIAHRLVHKHMCASAMIVYIFHRFVQEFWLDVGRNNLSKYTVKGPGIEEEESSGSWNRMGFAAFLMTANFITCFVIYFLLQTHWVLRKMFGIENL